MSSKAHRTGRTKGKASSRKNTKSAAHAKASTQQRRAYRCRKCGQPKKGHTCTADAVVSAVSTQELQQNNHFALSSAEASQLAGAWASEVQSGSSDEEIEDIYGTELCMVKTKYHESVKSMKHQSGRWYVDPRNYFPHEFRGKYLCERPDHKEKGYVLYRGNKMRAEDFKKMVRRWEDQYPVISTKKKKLPPVSKAKSKAASSSRGMMYCTLHETEAHKTAMTNKKHIREACWAKLPIIYDLPDKYRKLFKVDMYGNVIAPNTVAKNASLCFFEVDHVFPWSRGGRSVQANFQAVQSYANRVKGNRLHPAISDEDLLVGLTVAELKGLLKMVEDDDGGRRNKSRLETDLLNFLFLPPMTGRPYGGFRSEINQFEGNPEKLFNWFLERDQLERQVYKAKYASRAWQNYAETEASSTKVSD